MSEEDFPEIPGCKLLECLKCNEPIHRDCICLNEAKNQMLLVCHKCMTGFLWQQGAAEMIQINLEGTDP